MDTLLDITLYRRKNNALAIINNPLTVKSFISG
jgi:hypothetical protein